MAHEPQTPLLHPHLNVKVESMLILISYKAFNKLSSFLYHIDTLYFQMIYL